MKNQCPNVRKCEKISRHWKISRPTVSAISTVFGPEKNVAKFKVANFSSDRPAISRFVFLFSHSQRPLPCITLWIKARLFRILSLVKTHQPARTRKGYANFRGISRANGDTFIEFKTTCLVSIITMRRCYFYTLPSAKANDSYSKKKTMFSAGRSKHVWLQSYAAQLINWAWLYA